MSNNRASDLRAIDLTTAVWRKASASGGEGNCVEVAELSGGAKAVRDSKNQGREALRFTAGEWAAFREGVITGEL
ncbi:DUF397 domain-containing protein [Streptomyces graminilatus]|uniref:DUF397 domain-containing protein n=1 Tax=Streptomyces graminilatus TaxID=1464070 RepID=UPI0006E413E9|nr:DUF397 domain-containing protein [Streptomyces graminilatus]